MEELRILVAALSTGEGADVGRTWGGRGPDRPCLTNEEAETGEVESRTGGHTAMSSVVGGPPPKPRLWTAVFTYGFTSRGTLSYFHPIFTEGRVLKGFAWGSLCVSE